MPWLDKTHLSTLLIRRRSNRQREWDEVDLTPPERHLMSHPIVQSREALTAAKHIWTRHCPTCGKWLHKTLPLDPWICACGWRCP